MVVSPNGSPQPIQSLHSTLMSSPAVLPVRQKPLGSTLAGEVRAWGVVPFTQHCSSWHGLMAPVSMVLLFSYDWSFCSSLHGLILLQFAWSCQQLLIFAQWRPACSRRTGVNGIGRRVVTVEGGGCLAGADVGWGGLEGVAVGGVGVDWGGTCAHGSTDHNPA